MRIQEAARRSGASPSAIRFYEQLGLLGHVPRTATGYRVFSDREVRLLVFLRKARDLGYSLESCRDLLAIVTAPDRRSATQAARTRGLAAARLREIDAEIERLSQVRALIQLHLETIGAADGECPVSDSL